MIQQSLMGHSQYEAWEELTHLKLMVLHGRQGCNEKEVKHVGANPSLRIATGMNYTCCIHSGEIFVQWNGTECVIHTEKASHTENPNIYFM